MGGHIPTPTVVRREDKTRRIDRNLLKPIPQRCGAQSAVCILGTLFNPEIGPSSRMLARMEHAENLLHSGPSRYVVASGGTAGTSGGIITEAQLTARWFLRRGYPRLLRDDFASETVGNLIFSALGILLPLGVRECVFVTDVCHAPRVEAYSQHILQGLIKSSVAAAAWPLSEAEKQSENNAEKAGWHFLQKFLDDVPPGDPESAFDWVSANHQAQPYVGWKLHQIVAILRGQLYDFASIAWNASTPKFS